jgi:hypothetical protein
MPKTITLSQLQSHNACVPQLETFKELFGESVELSEELVERCAYYFDIRWCRRHLLGKSPEYDEQEELFWAEYVKEVTPFNVAYQKRESTLEEFEKQHAEVTSKYKKKCALLFYRLYKEQ